MDIRPSSLLKPTKKIIKPYECSLIASEGPNMLSKLNLNGIEIPFDTQFFTVVTLPANSVEFQGISYGSIHNKATFLAMKVIYNYNTNENSSKCKNNPMYLSYHFENDATNIFTIGQYMVLTGSEKQKIEQIYIKNESEYDAEVHILVADQNVEPDIAAIPLLKYWDTQGEFFKLLNSDAKGISSDNLNLMTTIEDAISVDSVDVAPMDFTYEYYAENLDTIQNHVITLIHKEDTTRREYYEIYGKELDVDSTMTFSKEITIDELIPTNVGKNSLLLAGVDMSGYPHILTNLYVPGWTKDTIVYKHIDVITSPDGKQILYKTRGSESEGQPVVTDFVGKDNMLTLTSNAENSLFPVVYIKKIKDEYGNVVDEDMEYILDKGEYIIEFDIDTKEYGSTDKEYILQRKVY